MDNTETRSSSSSKRSSAISSSDVQSIFTQSTSPVAQPSPKEHISHSRPSSYHSIGQACSAASSIPPSQPGIRSNRFSLTFPIIPPSKEPSPTRRSISPSRDSILPAAEAPNVPADPSDGNFLTAIAAQERRVLEIKEELQRAEADLDRLKLLWANHEAQKKKGESKHVTKLRPLSVALPSVSSEEYGALATWSQQQQEMERRRQLLANGPKPSRGKVFSGSRHTRTLSLLTPMQKDVPASATSSTRPRCDTSPDRALSQVSDHARPGLLARASTTPDLNTEVAKNTDLKLDLGELGIDRDMVLNTGKKMAMGIKDGLWTFWEDLRQATVGEEAIQVIPPQHPNASSSSQSLRSPRGGVNKGSLRGSSRGSNSSRRSADSKRTIVTQPSTEKRASPTKVNQLPPLLDLADPDGTVAEAVTSPSRTPKTTKRSAKHAKTPSVAVSTASSDAWDGWDDSPNGSRASSATSNSTSHRSPVTDLQGTPSKLQRSPTTISSTDPLPWPALGKLGGATLRRTASHLMSEWDKLSPPEKNDAKDYMESDAGAKSQKQDSVKQD